MMVLFDTDVCLSLLAGNGKIKQQFAHLLEEVCIPAPCVQELYLAAEQSARPDENRRVVDTFLTTVRVIYPDTETCRYIARLQKKLLGRNILVPQNDVVVFCISRMFAARLVTLHADRYRFT